MKMQKKIVSAALLLIVVATAAGGLAVPAQAKHEMYVYMWGVLVGQPLVRELPTGTWALIFWGWQCVTWEQCEDFLESIEFTWTIDGEPADYEILWLEVDGYPMVAFQVNWRPRTPGQYFTEFEVEFIEDHFDGWDWYYEGTSLPVGQRIILITPRDLYPQGPPSDF